MKKTLGLQPYPQKVVRPPKPTPTTFSGGGWSPRESELNTVHSGGLVGEVTGGLKEFLNSSGQSARGVQFHEMSCWQLAHVPISLGLLRNLLEGCFGMLWPVGASDRV